MNIGDRPEGHPAQRSSSPEDDRILLIIPTSAYSTGEFMAAATSLGIQVVVASDRRQVMDSVFPGGTLAVENFYDTERTVEQIVEHARRWPLRACIGIDDHGSLLAALACEALGIPHASATAVRAAGNKLLLRRALSAAVVPSPAFRLISVDSDPQREGLSTRYPCVLKPVFLTASRGVIRADDERAFGRAFSRIKSLLADSKVADRGGGEAARQILVEEYIPGIEVALDGLLTAGELRVLALFDKPDPLEGPYFAETLYITPSSLPTERQEEIAETVAAAARAIGLREGPVHAELRINNSGVFVIECAARSIGGVCSRVLRFGVGISLEELVLRHALGTPMLEAAEEGAGAGGVMMLTVPRQGVLRGVRGQDGARMVAHIEDVVISIPPDTQVEPLPEGDRYLGFMFARGGSAEIVEKALRQAFRQLEVVIEAGAEN